MNVVWWLSKTPYPKANNQNVLVEYSLSQKRAMKNSKNKKYVRPAGHVIDEKTLFKDNGGAIPSSLLTFANTSSNDLYLRRCKEAGRVIHPARFPEGFAEFFVKFLTDEGDLILDPFSGSNTTGFVSEKFNRHWLAVEQDESYWFSSQLRFPQIEPDKSFASTEERERYNACLF